MAVQTSAQPVPSEHAVVFYDHDAELSHTVASYLADGIRDGQVAIVIATEDHRHAFEAELEALGISPVAASADGVLVSIDAAELMSVFIVDGRISASAFDRVVGGVVRDAANRASGVRGYGEMVSILWEAGDVLAAIELERLWNGLATSVEFALLCGYRAESAAGVDNAEALEQVCGLHATVARTASSSFPAEQGSPRAARRFVADVLRESHHHGAVVDDAKLVLSELTTNAVRHAQTEFSVMVRCDPSSVRVAVRDASRARPERREADHTALAGRGLALVDALCREWGFDETSDGKRVWAELQS